MASARPSYSFSLLGMLCLHEQGTFLAHQAESKAVQQIDIAAPDFDMPVKLSLIPNLMTLTGSLYAGRQRHAYLHASMSCRTLPSNLALCVHPDFVYVKAKDPATGRVYVVAESLLHELPGAVPKESKKKDKGKAEPKKGGFEVVFSSSLALHYLASVSTLLLC